MKKMIDLHMHIIPKVDDGSTSMEMAEQMLQMAVDQGIVAVFATSHSWAYEEYAEYTNYQYRKLQKMIKEKQLPINVYQGCEMLLDIRFASRILENLENKKIPSLNGTKYVLTELVHGWGLESMQYLKIMCDKGWIPVIAHAERMYDLSIDLILKLKAMGCKIQINVYSVAEEKNQITQKRARFLLDEKMVDLVGSDAHRTEHRPPAVSKGIEYLYANYEEQYVDDILHNNAHNWILAGAE